MCFHIRGESYQFKALPFCLSIAPIGIRIHQYLDVWLVRTRSYQTCLQQTLIALCQELGWLVNMEKLELDPKQVRNLKHLQWWLEEDNMLQGQPLYPLKHVLQIFTDISKEGWRAHLGEHTARGTWSVPESKLHINYLELKAVFLAIKEFQDLCLNNIVLIAT